MAIDLSDLPPCPLKGADRFRADAKHDPIEAIKHDVQARALESGQVRKVRLVYRDAVSSRDATSRIKLRMTDNPLFLHWALAVGGSINDVNRGGENQYEYFELTRYHESARQLAFVCRPWNESKLNTMSTESIECGETVFTDAEILAVGAHYITCWDMKYSILQNNCQHLAGVVLADIVPSPQVQRRLPSLAESFVASTLIDPQTSFFLRLFGVNKARQDAFTDNFSDRTRHLSRQYEAERQAQREKLERDLVESETPLKTLASNWLHRERETAKIVADVNDSVSGIMFKKSRLDKLWVKPSAELWAPIPATGGLAMDVMKLGIKKPSVLMKALKPDRH